MTVVTEELIDRLPVPVQRCMRVAGVLGTAVPSEVIVHQVGRIRTSEKSKWLRFKSREIYEVEQPGFEWKAALKIGPMTAGRAIDTYRGESGRMHVKLLGMIDVVDAAGPEIDQGSLMRWLNETMWFPAVWATDLISWEPSNDTTAIGSVSSGDLTVRAEFCFDADGRFIDFHADRYRDTGDGGSELTPWSTPIREHARLGGLDLPAYGVGVWHLPDGAFEYIQIRATSVEYRT
jgi:Family of unknown function (DUF6544)